MLFSRESRRAPLLGLLTIASVFAQNVNTASPVSNHTTVLIVGGGMTGIIAARTLHEQGVNDFIVLDGKTELGGRMINHTFGIANKQVILEMGPSWIQGTQRGSGPINPVWKLALKHGLETVENDWQGSVTTFDDNGSNDYTGLVDNAADNFIRVAMFAGQRMQDGDVDASLRAAYGFLDLSSQTPQQIACDYYQNDFPSYQTSLFASTRKHNLTYIPGAGGFSNVHQMSTDQRGIAYILQAEVDTFITPQQLVLNQTVNLIEYSDNGVTVYTTGGLTITADHLLCTFSAGVLQNKDVIFQPPLPNWKMDAVFSIDMVPYTKVFLQFNETFWFQTEMGLYAAEQRGRFPVWQNLDHPAFFPGSGIIVATVTGDWALYIEQLTVDQVQSEAMRVLQTMYPNITIPEPVAIRVATWSTNILYRGSFANWGPSYFPGHSKNLKATVDNRLWFAGEATSVDYFGLLQGAYFEGQSAGYAIAECVKGNTTSCNAFPHGTIPKMPPT